MDLNDAIDIARHGKTSLKSARLIFVFKKNLWNKPTFYSIATEISKLNPLWLSQIGLGTRWIVIGAKFNDIWFWGHYSSQFLKLHWHLKLRTK